MRFGKRESRSSEFEFSVVSIHSDSYVYAVFIVNYIDRSLALPHGIHARIHNKYAYPGIHQILYDSPVEMGSGPPLKKSQESIFHRSQRDRIEPME